MIIHKKSTFKVFVGQKLHVKHCNESNHIEICNVVMFTPPPLLLIFSSCSRMARWWYSESFVVITRQLQAAKCSLSSQLSGHIFTLLENLRFPYCCTPCKQTFVTGILVCSSLGPCIKNLLFNFR
jgi:hypothetical protein